MGGFIRREILEPLGLGVSAAAEALGVARPTLSRLLNEHSALTWDMALRIEKAFGPSADHLMRMQFAYDRAEAHARAPSIKVRRVVRTPLT